MSQHDKICIISLDNSDTSLVPDTLRSVLISEIFGAGRAENACDTSWPRSVCFFRDGNKPISSWSTASKQRNAIMRVISQSSNHVIKEMFDYSFATEYQKTFF
jgi:hypothetical protein